MKLSVEKQKFWQSHLKAQRESGMTISRYCKEHNLVRHQFMYHRKKYSQKLGSKPAAGFVPVNVLPDSQVSITIGGVKLSFDASIDPKWLAKLICEVGRQHALS